MADLQTVLKNKVEIDGLKNVELSAPANGDVLAYNSTAGEWQNTAPPAPTSALDDLTDVTLTTPASGNVLKYDGTKWINDTPVAGLALGETSSTAYRGDRGKAAYDHSQVSSGNPHSVSKSDVGLGNVTNDAQLKASQLDTNTSLGSSDTKVPSQKAVKTYVDGRPTGITKVEDDATPKLGGNLDGNSKKIVNLATPTSDGDAATKKYVDDNAGGGGSSISLTAGEALSAWNVVGIDSSGALKKADATAGIAALGYVSAGVASAATAEALLAGLVTGSGLTAGDDVYLDDAGGVTQTAPESGTLQRLGVAVSSTSWIFDKGEPIELE